ncbi:MAG: hypothetical protein WHV67_01030 [Thermoanaerobaculia bacterium]
MKKHIFVFSFFLFFNFLEPKNILAQQNLTMEKRIKVQEAIERFYYEKRIWPKENPNPKPPFEDFIIKEILKKKVEDYIKKSLLLEKIWKRPITREQLQAEIERITKNTKDPETLKDLFLALENDPYLIAECLARQILADRLIRNWYAYDERFHENLKKEAKNLKEKLTFENFKLIGGERYRDVYFKKKDYFSKNKFNNIELDGIDFKIFSSKYPEERKISNLEENETGFSIKITYKKNEKEIYAGVIFFEKEPFEKWFKKESDLLDIDSFIPTEGPYSITQIEEDKFLKHNPDTWKGLRYLPEPRAYHTAIWTGTEMIIWGGHNYYYGYEYLKTGWRYNPATDNWTEISTINTPSERSWHTAIWTGKEMIVWGGYNGDFLNTGGRYNPIADTWTEISTENAPSGREKHTAVWTGTEMIIWGGWNGNCLNTGGRYNPFLDTWNEISTANAPFGRDGHTAVWTGTEMIIWGGSYFYQDYHYLNTGGRYNPSSDTWHETSTTNVPSGRENHTAVWTGKEMIIWGGFNCQYFCRYLDTGAKYNPITDSWSFTSKTNSPEGRCFHTAVWTGSEMIVWGGYYYDKKSIFSNTGARYNPDKNTWAKISTENAPSGRWLHSAVWTGSEMIVWGGGYYDGMENFLNTGGRYNPAEDSWVQTNITNAPSERFFHTAIWTGNEMIIWGGDMDYLNTGERYDPVTDTWTPTSTNNAPCGRDEHTAVWTGREMIIWGGYNNVYKYLKTGARYNPATDTWAETSTVNAPSERGMHTAIWTGNQMIIWGGYNVNILNTGGIYDPADDSWLETSKENAPSERSGHTAIWTGKEMIVWGGHNYNSYYGLNTGGRYNPISDSWEEASIYDSPSARSLHTAVWTGTEMIVWGGYDYDPENGLNTGGRYNPISDSWEETLIDKAPSGRYFHTAVWTGYSMIIWGGYPLSQSGGIYYLLSSHNFKKN